MNDLTDSRVFAKAREVLRTVRGITERGHGFGDLHNQIRRAAVSVVSNIAEAPAAKGIGRYGGSSLTPGHPTASLQPSC